MRLNMILIIIVFLLYLYSSNLKTELVNTKTKNKELSALIMLKNEEIKKSNQIRAELNKKLQNKKEKQINLIKKVSKDEKSKNKLDDYFLNVFNSL